MTALVTSLGPLVDALRADGYRVVGPTVRDQAIVLAELHRADELPVGWGTQVGPGGYRLVKRDDRAAFAHTAGPRSAKDYLHPSKSLLWTSEEAGGAEEPRYALLGVRPCDVRAIAVQDRVLGASDSYAARRAALFVVAVNCTEPGETCFCVSAGGGPSVSSANGYDLALTELADARYLVEVGSAAGEEMLARLPHREATREELTAATQALDAAVDRMGRELPAVDLRQLLAERLESPRWDEVAQRCLACGNCTLVCPTCFCTTVDDTTDLTGDIARRWQSWASCFDLDFSYLHGGAVRTSTRSRYRQWLTHKFGTWHDQFGESGCVGCGRCIAWCPVGIDVTEELTALTGADQ